MYNNDVGKGVVYAYEAYEVKYRVAAFRAPIYFINLWLISYRHRYCTYLYYSHTHTHTHTTPPPTHTHGARAHTGSVACESALLLRGHT
jgi:hypothetical protein